MKRRLRYAAKWVFHYVLSPIVPHIPLAMLRQMAALLGTLNFLLNTEIRHYIQRNLKEVFPDKSDKEIRDICQKNFINHAMHSLEILYLPAVDKQFVQKNINVRGFDHVEAALQKGNGIVLVLGHIGFYYLSGITAQLLGVPMNDISQDITKLNITKIDRKILTRRLGNYQSRISGKIFHRGGPLLGVVKAIKRNEAISLFIDAMTTEKDPIVDFLGHRTRAPQGPIRIAMQTGAAIIFSSALHERDGSMTLTFYKPVELDLTNERERDLQVNAQKLTDLLEPVIYRHPDQWHLWRTFHERFFKEDAATKQESESSSSGAGRRHDGSHSTMG